MDLEESIAYIETDFATRKKTVITEMPGSDSTSNSYYQPVEVSKSDFTILKERNCEYYEDLVHEILGTYADRS